MGTALRPHSGNHVPDEGVPRVASNDDMRLALRLLLQPVVDRLAVVDDDEVVGSVTMADIRSALGDRASTPTTLEHG